MEEQEYAIAVLKPCFSSFAGFMYMYVPPKAGIMYGCACHIIPVEVISRA